MKKGYSLHMPVERIAFFRVLVLQRCTLLLSLLIFTQNDK